MYRDVFPHAVPRGIRLHHHRSGTPGGKASLGFGINAGGQLTGASIPAGGDGHAFRYDGGMQDPCTPGCTASFGYDINDSF